MRNFTVISALLLGGFAVAADDAPRQADRKDLPELSKRFLASLQSEKLKDCMACWVSVERIRQLMKNPLPGEPRPSPEDIRKAIAYFQERDKVIKERFPKIIKTLKAHHVAPKDLVYVKSEGVAEKKGSYEGVTNVDMVFKAPDATLVGLSVDDGLKLDGKWYFSDKPHAYISLSGNGKERHIPLSD